jgi:phosphatidylserine/phosphatidylglycerophosphate/cardiolipin synthase-like enzyme
MLRPLIVAAMLAVTSSPALAFDPQPSHAFTAGATYQTCFTPGQDCEGLIVAEIQAARSAILLQAYSFTSKPIAAALMQAKRRGVDVRAVLDKSQRTERYSGATFLADAGIPVVIDEKPAIAHNKVMVIDGATVITGSFNFTRAAQERNAENVFVIRGDREIARRYAENWQSRARASVPYAR